MKSGSYDIRVQANQLIKRKATICAGVHSGNFLTVFEDRHRRDGLACWVNYESADVVNWL
jgi:hypothetical protein